MRLVEVEWVDSTSHCGSPWRSHEDLEAEAKMTSCFTAGFLFSEDDGQVTVALSHWGEPGDGEVGMAITIPRQAVVAVRDLQRELPLLATM